MTGSTHFIAGAAIGRLTGNPILAAILGLLFHFIMDLIPHWDYGYHFQKKIKHFLMAGSEPLIGMVVWVFIGLHKDFSLETWIVTFVGGAFCLLPDVMSVLVRLFRLNFLRSTVTFHAKLHWFIPGIKDMDFMAFEKKSITKKGIFFGILYQIPIIVISLWILLS